MASRGTITPANSHARIARRNELAAQGKIKLGRPPSILTKKKIEETKSVEAFKEVLREQLGGVADDLLRNSRSGDTAASKVIVEQIAGKPKETQDVNVRVFDIYALAQSRGTLPPVDVNADVVKDVGMIEAPESHT